LQKLTPAIEFCTLQEYSTEVNHQEKLEQNGKVFLTVAIPFRNNFQHLEFCLSSVKQNLGNLEHYVEVLVSCNPMNKEMAHTFSEFMKQRFPDFTFLIHDANLSYDAHLEKIPFAASGKYIKFLAEDDWLPEHGIHRLLQIISSEKPSAIVTNFKFFNSNLSKVLQKKWYESEVSSQRELKGLNTVRDLSQINFAYGQVSSLTFKTSELRRCRAKHFVTDHIQVFWFLECMSKGNTFASDQTLVHVRQGSPNFVQTRHQPFLTPLKGLSAISMARSLKPLMRMELLLKQGLYLLKVITAFPSLERPQRDEVKHQYRRYWLQYPFILTVHLILLHLPLRIWRLISIIRRYLKYFKALLSSPTKL
jgi:hypothetical protein